MKHMIYLLVLVVGGLSQIAQGETEELDLTQLQAAVGEQPIDSVKTTPVPGLYEVVSGSEILYLSEDGQFVLQGDLIDLKARDNLTEARRSDLRVKLVEAVGEENMVVFAPAKPAEHTVTVFTDIDCGYCRKFHNEITDYNQKGIKVRYLMFPRAGVDSESYDKAVSVWCADDRQTAMTRAKGGESIEPKTCANPVQAQTQLGQSLGVRGTPSIVLENGQMVPGYVPPTRLAQILDEMDQSQ